MLFIAGASSASAFFIACNPSRINICSSTSQDEAREKSAACELSHCNADSLLPGPRTRSKHSRPLGTSMVAHLHGFHRLHGLANKVSGATSQKPLPPARHEQASKRLLPLQVVQCSTLLLLGAFILLHCEETCQKSRIPKHLAFMAFIAFMASQSHICCVWFLQARQQNNDINRESLQT